MTEEFARLSVRDLPGVFAARRLGRELAATLALDRQDQVRVATALSEIGRDLVVSGQKAVIAFLASNDSEWINSELHYITSWPRDYRYSIRYD